VAKLSETQIAAFRRKHSPDRTLLRRRPSGRAIVETYEIRVLTKKRAQDGIYSSSRGNDHAAMRGALALASPCEAIIEVWCGTRCVFAGQLAEVCFSE
jgi:hypothetical protein